jgi:nucleoside-diphosphate-sugar epimerase
MGDGKSLVFGILGGNGFIGSAFPAEVERLGHTAVVIGKDDYDVAIGASYDVLVNANGNSRKYLARRNPAYEFDLSVRSVARSVHDFKVGLYIYLSTVDVYPDCADTANNGEDTRIDASLLSPYGFHKYLAEQLVRRYTDNWLIFRMAGFVGNNLWKNSIYDILKLRPLRVHPDSEYQYLHTSYLARTVIDIAISGTSAETVNVAGRGLVKLRDVAATVPGYDISTAPTDVPREYYEINTAKLETTHTIPSSRETVALFVKSVLEGRVTLR